MGKAECPQSEVRSRVRDTSETEFDCVDGLVDEDLAKVENLFDK